MTEQWGFKPDWVSPPGDSIAGILDERGLSLTDFARRMRRSCDEAKQLLTGRAVITLDIACQLASVLGASAAFWMNREAQYRADFARLHREWSSGASAEWLTELPVRDMIRFGWVEPARDPADKVMACLRFFGVSHVDVWRRAYKDVLQKAVFRTSPSFESQPGAVAAWLRHGECEAASIECKRWNAGQFESELLKIRALTRKKEPGVFIPELTERCATCGVAVVVARAPVQCRASGATRLLPRGRRLLLLSFRHLSDDHFWFSFFHEAGHLLLHGEGSLFLEGSDTISPQAEEEANDFAARTLIPSGYQAAMRGLRADGLEVIRFARLVGVSAGIVVGQLQYLGQIKPSQLNNLKRHFRWAHD